jgi:hypothetical protein
MQARKGRSSSGVSRARSLGRGVAGLSLLATAMTLVLLLPSLAAAAQPAVTTIKAPYTSAVVTLTNPTTHAGTGKTVRGASAFFNKTTGIGGFADNASASWRNTSTNNSALATGRIQVNLPITISTTGTHTISVVWITVATGSVNLTKGSCTGSATIASTSCTRFAQTFVNGFAILLDKTNGSSTRVQNWPGNFTAVWDNTTCSFLHCTSTTSSKFTGALHTGKAFWAWDFTSVSLVSTHHYVVEMFLFGGSEVTLQVNGAMLKGASGNAQFNSATRGNDEVLNSVSIN